MKYLFYALAALLPGSAIAQTATHVVISEVYGGGGNSGATYINDFIELYNPTASPVSLTGWSVQYASSTGVFNQRTNLSGSIPANGFYLIQQAAGSGGTLALPAPDVTGTIAMAGASGKVALVSDTAFVGSNCTASTIIDLLGYGSASNCSETTPTGNLSNTTSAERKASATSTAASLAPGGAEEFAGNGYDAGINSTDYVVQSAINPQNSSVAEGGASATTIAVRVGAAAAEPATDGTFIVSVGAPAPVGGITLSYTLSGTATRNTDYTDPKSGTITIAAGKLRDTVVIDIIDDLLSEGNESVIITLSAAPTGYTVGTGTATMTIVDNEVFITKISAIQGTGATAVAGSYSAEAIVTGVYPDLSPGGFYMQEEPGDTDANAASSEGIFVVSTTSVSVGDKVQVTGQVLESSAAPSYGQAVFSTGSTVNILSRGNSLPPATVLTLPVTALADFERLEGMIVRFPDTLTVTNNYGLDRYGELALSAGGLVWQPTELIDPNDNPATGTSSTGAGNAVAVKALADANLLRTITLDDGRNTTTSLPYVDPVDSTLRLGSRVSGLSGIMGYAFNVYRIQPMPSAQPAFTYAARPAAPKMDTGDLVVTSFNVLNYFNGNGSGGGFPTARGAHSAAEFTRQRTKIIAALSQINADIVGVIEMENDGTGPNSAIQDLVNGLNSAMGAGTYAFIDDGTTTQAGNTDAIRCGILYKPAAVTPYGIAMLGSDVVFNRPPLAQAFTEAVSGKKLVYVVNHFKSKGCGSSSGADTDQGDGQSCYNDTRRDQSAALLRFFNATVIPTAGTGLIMTMGDYNAYKEEDPMDVLRAGGYQVLSPAGEYSYQFSGQIGSLDHAVASDSLNRFVSDVVKWNINAAEPVYLDYNDAINDGGGDFANPFGSTFRPNAYRSSDHDPILVGLNFTPPVNVGVGNGSTGSDARIVPNPAGPIATLKSTKPMRSVTLYSIDGRRIFSRAAGNNQELELNLSDCAPGLYSIELHFVDGSRSQLRVSRTN